MAVGPAATKLAGKLAIVGTADDAAAPLIVAEGGSGGVYRVATGELLATKTVHHAYAAASGDLALLLGAPAKDLDLVRLPAAFKEGAALPAAAVAVPDAEIAGPGQAALLWGELAHQGVRPAQKPHLFIAPLTPTGVGHRHRRRGKGGALLESGRQAHEIEILRRRAEEPVSYTHLTLPTNSRV